MTNVTSQNAAPVISQEQIDDYRQRERLRLCDGTYLPLPAAWKDGLWFMYGLADRAAFMEAAAATHREAERTGDWSNAYVPYCTPYTDHFAHISTEDGGCVAFTENHVKGVADRQTRMKPGRYLKKYYGHCLSDEQIRDIATAFMAECAPVTLKFAATADEIVHVYLNGPRSCMSHGKSDYYGHVHPVSVYGDSDLQVAYFDRGDDAIKARAICWPAKKLYGRVYGDGARLEPMLRAAGYTEGSMVGARIRAIENERGNGWIMPYIDEVQSADLEGEWFVIRHRGEYCCDSTGGVIEEERTCCEHCGDRIDDDDAYSIDGRDGLYCASCESELTVECARTGNRIDRDDAIQMANGDFWSQRSFNRHGFRCPIMHDNYPDDEGVEMADGDTWSQEAFDGQGFTCQGNGGNYARAEMVVLADGALWCEEHFADYGHVNDAGENVRNADAPVDRLGYRCDQTLEMPLVQPLVAPSAPANVFQAGDIVECTANCEGQFTAGRLYQVTRVYADYSEPRISVLADDRGHGNGWMACHFIHAPRAVSVRELDAATYRAA